mgnify:CR=1 FL=1
MGRLLNVCISLTFCDIVVLVINLWQMHMGKNVVKPPSNTQVLYQKPAINMREALIWPKIPNCTQFWIFCNLKSSQHQVQKLANSLKFHNLNCSICPNSEVVAISSPDHHSFWILWLNYTKLKIAAACTYVSLCLRL